MGTAEEELSRWYANCDPDSPLRQDWYVPLDAWTDPVTQQIEALRGAAVAESLERIINRSAPPAAFLMAGFRGTGKTTELGRVRRALVGLNRYAVVQFSASDYHHLSDALSKEELGLMIAAGIAEAAGERDASWRKSIWREMANFLGEVVPKDVSVKFGPVELKGILRSSSEPDFRERLRQVFSQEPDRFRSFVHGIVDRAVAHYSPARLVLLVDGLDKYYADVADLGRVYRSMADRFAQDVDLLRLPGCLVVYVVPPYLAFLHQNVADQYGGRPFLMASVKVHERPPDRTPFSPGRRALAEVLSRRVDLDRLFGHHRALCVDAITEASGGHVRDLLLLVRQVLGSAAGIPVPPDDVDAQIQILSNTRGLVFRQGVELLERVVVDGKINAIGDEEIAALARAFDQQLLLCYHNGQPWYDVHPLVRRALQS